MKPLQISQAMIRRYFIGQQGLWPGRRWQSKEGAAQAIRQMGGLQIDPLDDENIAQDEQFAAALTRGLAHLARFLQAAQIDITVVQPANLRDYLTANLP